MADSSIRWSGVLLLAGALLLGASLIMASFGPATAHLSPATSVLMLVASVLVMLALPTMYIRQANSAGALGLVGHILLEVGMTFLVVYVAAPLLFPTLKEPPGESPLAFFLGIALVLSILFTSIASLRAGIFPRWSGILLLGAAMGFFFDYFLIRIPAALRRSGWSSLVWWSDCGSACLDRRVHLGQQGRPPFRLGREFLRTTSTVAILLRVVSESRNGVGS
jgi:hypothetical protein